MKKKLFAALLFAFRLTMFAQNGKEDVKEIIQSAYVNGIHNGGPIEDIKAGFHEDFIIHSFSDNGVNEVTIQNWVANIEKGRNLPGYGPNARPKSHCQIH